jgi:phosphomannomutase
MPPLYFGKSKIPCPNHLKSAVICNLIKKADSLGARSVSKIDGLKIEYDDAWLLLRASGTEPAIRVIAETSSPQQTAVLIIRGAEFVEDAAKDLEKCAVL